MVRCGKLCDDICNMLGFLLSGKLDFCTLASMPRPMRPRPRPRVVFAAPFGCVLGRLTHVASQCANMKKDPHLAFARGGRADFRGRNGAYYSFLSTPSFAINVRTEEAQFKTYRDALTVDGSFITEVHGVAQVGGEKHKLATASFWTSELNEFTTGPNMINGPRPVLPRHGRVQEVRGDGDSRQVLERKVPGPRMGDQGGRRASMGSYKWPEAPA